MLFKACPECGNIYEIDDDSRRLDCFFCRVQGKTSYLVSIFTLMYSAFRESQLGNEQLATHRFGIAIALVRYHAITECIRLASAEYYEAQREGLDNNAAWGCAIDSLSQLLKDYDSIVPKES